MSENYFETKKCKEEVDFILKEYECPDLLNEQSNAKALDKFIEEYNWGDGSELPYYIINHRNCELGTALKIFYLAEGIMLLEKDYKNFTLGHWVELIEYAYEKIANGKFSSRLIGFKFTHSEAIKNAIKEAGWPDVFIEDIVV